MPTAATETDSPAARLAVTYDGGVLVLDASTLDVLGDFPLVDPVYLDDAGDGRHVTLMTESNVRVLDTGAWTEPHGDHSHSYTAQPALTGVEFDLPQAWHVVAHAGMTAIFSDTTGSATVFDPNDLAEGQPDVETIELSEPHHGVAIPLRDGTIVSTDGSEEETRSIVSWSGSGEEVARTDACPGVHGEAAAAADRLAFGCTGGAVVYSDGEFTAVPAPDAEASIDTASGTEASPVVLMNYQVEGAPEDADGPTRVALLDTAAGSMSIVELPVPYSWTTLGRGPEGEALILGTDGMLRVLDPESGTIIGEVSVVPAWELPEKWDDPRPSIAVLDDRVWVADPRTSRLTVVDIDTREVLEEQEIDVQPTGVLAVTG